MKCEACENEHDGSYGSGRFCSTFCAHSIITKGKSQRPEDVAKRAVAIRAGHLRSFMERDWSVLKRGTKKKRILMEQGGVCLHCGISEWMGKPISLELDHIDGDKKNEARENLRVLCPNCHAQTETWKRIKSSLP